MSSPTASCGCSHPCAPATQEPIVCTLEGRDQAKRAAEFGEAFLHLDRTEPFDGGFFWHFRAQAGLEARLRDLAEREHECCRFFEFRISSRGASIVWEVRTEDRARKVLEEFMRLPTTIGRMQDVDSMKRLLNGAGLVFTSDVEELDSRSTFPTADHGLGPSDQ